MKEGPFMRLMLKLDMVNHFIGLLNFDGLLVVPSSLHNVLVAQEVPSEYVLKFNPDDFLCLNNVARLVLYDPKLLSQGQVIHYLAL